MVLGIPSTCSDCWTRASRTSTPRSRTTRWLRDSSVTSVCRPSGRPVTTRCLRWRFGLSDPFTSKHPVVSRVVSAAALLARAAGSLNLQVAGHRLSRHGIADAAALARRAADDLDQAARDAVQL